MSELPSGTVTLLFTDIEGSTQLLKRFGALSGELLAQHQRIIRDAAAAFVPLYNLRRGARIRTRRKLPAPSALVHAARPALVR